VLDNAVKYSPPDSTVRVRLDGREGTPDGSRVTSVISVADEGAGMDPATQERAFEQFFRSVDARRLAPDGSGVGLYAARGLVRAMGGEMTIDSRLGFGTTVSIELPAERAESLEAHGDQGTVAVPPSRTHPAR
jgi:signal transduction histidine kinase